MALKGIKVLEFAGLAPGPFCGKILKDLGARVIRIDRTGASEDVDRLSHGKESIAINLKSPKGIEIIKKLSKNADVLIEPFRKGVMERLGLGPSQIFQENPRIIYARLTGYGQFGELSKKAGHDINYISYSGVLSTLGRANEKPYAPINLIADFAGGGLMCALSIVSSLYERDTKGIKEKVIDLAMVEGAAYLSSWLWTSRDIPGVWDGENRGKNLLDGGFAPYETYETKDGKYMACGSLEPAFFNNLLKGVGLSDNEEITHEKLQSIFKTKTRHEWEEVFRNLDACVSPILEMNEAPIHPHNKERKSFIELKDGSVLPTMNWLNQSSQDQSYDMPMIGQHTSNVLKDFNFTNDEISQFLAEKIIADSSQTKSKL
ncbi:unnamed protein product [Brachionus calyciflorus]|uniref:Alpha-methylacyl-CoA racemase n=1 Tax=Brachionus calyciflorus TaxID=104777 RepID=A0A813M2C9_9BILA|nr:unnamed protein product [Brachionus calyciflorus]